MRLIFSLAVLVLVACSPPQAASTGLTPAPATAATPVAAAPGESTMFTAPSGNIGCAYTPAGGTAIYDTPDGRAELQCDRIEPTYVRVVMSEAGAAHIVETEERGCCSGDAIPYGDSWSEGPFSCEITEAGVACRNSAGNGFTLSRSRADVH